MSTPPIAQVLLRRKKALAAAIILAGGFAATETHATSTWTVNTCADTTTGSLVTKTGSLRFAAQNAATGDTIDLSQLPTTYSCSTITLQTGAVNFAQQSLILQGSAANPITISGKYCPAAGSCTVEPDRIINHTGTGTLDVYGLELYAGHLTSAANAFGGCLYSKGNVILDHSEIKYCKASAGSGVADGGGVLAFGTVSLASSTVKYNTAYSSGASSFGGGFFSLGAVDIRKSTIEDNSAKTKTSPGFGGGMQSNGSVYMLDSTVSGNYSSGNFGGVYVTQGLDATKTVTLINSTISSNSAHQLVGGLFTTAHNVRFDNSTIAFNTASIDRTGTSPNFHYYAPGVSLSTDTADVSVTMHSSLIANNTATGEYDLSVANNTGSFTITFSGSNNLVRSTFASVPPDTIKFSCPLLGPLRDNGGGTPTHALLSGSAGIDVGINSAGQAFDQRGSPYARTSGTAPDIGAYEIQKADIIFNTSFESCPLLL